MEWQSPKISDLQYLRLSGEILRLDSDIPDLRKRLYQPGLSWPALTDFAAGHDILPPLIWSLKTKSLLPPVPKSLAAEKRAGFVTSRLDENFSHHIARRNGLQAQLQDAVAALSQAGIAVLLLKGAKYLLDSGAAWELARPMRDIDLLIRPEDAARAITALTGIGYTPDAPSGLQSHHLPELRQAGRHGVIELHTHALAPAGRRHFSTAQAWDVSMQANMPAGSARILPARWQALHAMLHHQASDNGFSLRNLALKPLWEFTCLAAEIDEPGWTGMINQLEQSGGIDLLADWCLQAHALYQLPLPNGLQISAAARRGTARTFTEATHPESLRRARFILRQLGRGFSRAMIAARYNVPERQVGLRLRAKHLLFLLARYRGQFGHRLLGLGGR